MTDIQKRQVTKELVRASDAMHSAFLAACHANDLDLANDLRLREKALGEKITAINGGPVRMSKTELLGAFR